MARKLASLLDEWSQSGTATVFERSELVIVSELGLSEARTLLGQCAELNWRYDAADGSDSPCTLDDIDDAIPPVRLDIHKPKLDAASYFCLTENGFNSLMRELPTDISVIYVATLDMGFRSKQAQYIPWGNSPDPVTFYDTKNPRELIKCFGAVNLTPKNIGLWLLEDSTTIPAADCGIFTIWAQYAARNLTYCLASEIDYEARWMDFLGPPKLRIQFVPEDTDIFSELGCEGFATLQSAAKWVYEDASAAEQRHTYLATEFARYCAVQADIIHHVKHNLAHALESAKIAYRLGLSEVSVSTLNALTQLRKTVADETAKISDSTRQMTTSVLGAVASGVALIILRLNTNTSPIIVLTIGITIVLYLIWVCWSGNEFMQVQRSLRQQWKTRLYRFLTTTEYESMVDDPIDQAEKIYSRTIVIACLCTALLVVAVLFSVATRDDSGQTTTLPSSHNSKMSKKPLL